MLAWHLIDERCCRGDR